jgi:hypothetical protein
MLWALWRRNGRARRRYDARREGRAHTLPMNASFSPTFSFGSSVFGVAAYGFVLALNITVDTDVSLIVTYTLLIVYIAVLGIRAMLPNSGFRRDHEEWKRRARLPGPPIVPPGRAPQGPGTIAG